MESRRSELQTTEGWLAMQTTCCSNNLTLAAKDPKGIADTLINKHKHKLKGTGEIAFHLGCDFHRDDEGVLCFAPKKHTDKII